MRLLIVGVVLTLVWVVFALVYIDGAVGFENLGFLLPHELGLTLLAVLVPPALTWVVLLLLRIEARLRALGETPGRSRDLRPLASGYQFGELPRAPRVPLEPDADDVAADGLPSAAEPAAPPPPPLSAPPSTPPPPPVSEAEPQAPAVAQGPGPEPEAPAGRRAATPSRRRRGKQSPPAPVAPRAPLVEEAEPAPQPAPAVPAAAPAPPVPTPAAMAPRAESERPVEPLPPGRFAELEARVERELNAIAMDLSSVVSPPTSYDAALRDLNAGNEHAFFELLAADFRVGNVEQVQDLLRRMDAESMLHTYVEKYEHLLAVADVSDGSGTASTRVVKSGMGHLHAAIIELQGHEVGG